MGAVQVTGKKLASLKGMSASDIEYKIGHVEHKVRNRDLILDTIENRLARLESERKKN